MKAFNLEEAINGENGFLELETLIGEMLVPIAPRPNFVNNLKIAILKQEENGQQKAFRYGAIGAAGFISALVLIATSIQAIITLIGTIKVLRQLRFDLQKDSAMS